MPGFGKSWKTHDEITSADELSFRAWVDSGMARGGGRKARTISPLALASLSSSRESARSISREQEELDVQLKRCAHVRAFLPVDAFLLDLYALSMVPI